MVLGEQLDRWFKKREQERLDKAVAEAVTEAVAEARAEAVAQTQAEVQQRWSEWNSRRMDAEARGEPFDEPPPGFDSTEANGSQQG